MQIEINQVRSLLQNLDSEVLKSFLNDIESILKNRNEKDPKSKEKKLIEKLNQTALSGEKLERYIFLIEKRRTEEITESEMDELIGLVKEDQNMSIQRIHILTEISKLTGLSPEALAKKLGLKPAASV